MAVTTDPFLRALLFGALALGFISGVDVYLTQQKSGSPSPWRSKSTTTPNPHHKNAAGAVRAWMAAKGGDVDDGTADSGGVEEGKSIGGGGGDSGAKGGGVKFVFFVGIEGTGHHLMTALLKDSPCVKRADQMGLREDIQGLVASLIHPM